MPGAEIPGGWIERTDKGLVSFRLDFSSFLLSLFCELRKCEFEEFWRGDG